MWAEQNKSRASRPSKQQDFSPLPHSAAVVAATTEKTAAERRNARKNGPLKLTNGETRLDSPFERGNEPFWTQMGRSLMKLGP